MLTIRPVQLATLEASRAREFPLRLAKYAKLRAPHGGDGEKAIADLVSYGLQKAQEYGFRAEGDILRYFDLMLRYGRDFDTEPTLPFSDRILEERMVFEREPLIQRLEEVSP